MALTAGIDIGTTTIAAVVFDTMARRVVADRSVPNDTATTSPEDARRGRSEWDADAMVDRALACLAAAADQAPGEISAIGVTGQMHGMLLLDADGRPASSFIGWQDQRCEERTNESAPNTVEQMIARAGPEGFARAGCAPATGYMAATLFWMATHGHDLAGLRACFISDYLVMRLTDCDAATDPTHAGGAGVLDVTTRVWDARLIEALGLIPDLFPAIRPSGSVAGATEGTPVCVACGDNQASVLGTMADPSGTLFVNIGTGAQVSMRTSSGIAVDGADTRCHIDGDWLLVGAPLCGGTSYALLGEFFRRVAADVFGVDERRGVLDTLTRLAADVPPGADGLRCEPLFIGTRHEPQRRAAWSGMTPINFTPGHMARAILEGIAEQLRLDYGRMLAAGATPCSRMVGSGNGIRKNALMPDILSAAFGLPLVVSEQQEEAALGAAIQAAVACGAFGALDDAWR